MILDKGQAAFIDQLSWEELINGGEKVLSLLDQGLLFEGKCPRCGHWMYAGIAFGLDVGSDRLGEVLLEQGLIESLSGAKPSESRLRAAMKWAWERAARVLTHKGPAPASSPPQDIRITFVCACGRGHDGRPDAATFLGCGAAWKQRPRRKETDSFDPPLIGATPEEAAWAVHIEELAATPFSRVRAGANQWPSGVTSLTAVLTAAALLGGPADASKFHPLAKWLVLGLSGAGFVSLLLGTISILFASTGVSGYDHRLMSTQVLRRYERQRGREAIGQIVATQIYVVIGVLLLAIAAGIAFANPA